MNYLNKYYNKVIKSDISAKYNYQNINNIPYIDKIVINMGTTNTNKNKNNLLESLIALELITGQKAEIIKAKKSISTFYLRKSIYTACKVTLRNDSMYSFLNNLIYIVLPRIREFKGISSHSFDGHGNYNLSINNLFVFPEIEYQYDLFHKNYGLDISIVTTAKTDLECRVLLSNFQLPFNLIKK